MAEKCLSAAPTIFFLARLSSIFMLHKKIVLIIRLQIDANAFMAISRDCWHEADIRGGWIVSHVDAMIAILPSKCMCEMTKNLKIIYS